MKKLLFAIIMLLVYLSRIIHLITWMIFNGKIPSEVYYKLGVNNDKIGVYTGYLNLKDGLFANLLEIGRFGGKAMSKPKSHLGQITFYI
jgi:hypothetical protein